MTHKLYFALSFICLIAVIATQCSNAPSRAVTTSAALPVAAPLEPAASAEAIPCRPDADEIAGDHDEAQPSQEARNVTAAATSTIVAAASDVEGLRISRLVLARDIEDREPVDADSRFSPDEERIYAFMEMVNASDEDKQVVVTFERDDGTSVGHIRVNVPAHSPRWRTWAWTRHANTPGTWTAVISTPEGTEIGRERFEIES
jgi:hypothetical protein